MVNQTFTYALNFISSWYGLRGWLSVKYVVTNKAESDGSDNKRTYLDVGNVVGPFIPDLENNCW